MNQRIEAIDLLRGLAALSVCWFHFTHGNAGFLSDGVLKATGAYGWLGVEVFFVISGFIIPYALQRAGYRLHSYPRFLVKRITRLDPPYVVSIIIVLVLAYLSTLAPGFRGKPFEVDAAGVVLRLGYLNTFFKHDWINPVYWTLAIEFQYYLLMGLIFPLVSSRRRLVRLTAFALLGALAFAVTDGAFIFHHLFLFLLGMTLFQHRTGLADKWETLALLTVFGLCVFLTLGAPPTVAAALAVTGIAFCNVRNVVFGFLGNISYSLYLLHVPVGGRVVNLGQRFADGDAERLVLLLAALGLSVASAYLLYRFVEKPAQEWSAAMSYRRREGEAKALVPVGYVGSET